MTYANPYTFVTSDNHTITVESHFQDNDHPDETQAEFEDRHDFKVESVLTAFPA